MPSLSYNNFDGTTTPPVISTLPTILGTTNPSGPSGAINSFHSAINQIN